MRLEKVLVRTERILYGNERPTESGLETQMANVMDVKVNVTEKDGSSGVGVDERL